MPSRGFAYSAILSWSAWGHIVLLSFMIEIPVPGYKLAASVPLLCVDVCDCASDPLSKVENGG